MTPEDHPRPPSCRRVPHKIVTHGHERVDEFYWLRDRGNPGVIEHIEAENRYSAGMMKHTETLQTKLFEEMRGRIAETDESVPVMVDDFYYYTRTEKGKQYPIHCRKFESLDADEENVLDENVVAQGNKFFSISLVKASPDHEMLMYLADTDGSERHTLFIKDLTTGEVLPETMRNAHDAEWANDSATIFYSTLDHENRPDKVWRHVLGTSTKEDVLVYHEKDPSFYYLQILKTKTNAFIMITVESAITTEVHYVSADVPDSELKVFRSRVHGVEYFVKHHGGRFFIITNENAVNFKIMEAPVSDPSRANWKELVPHREKISIDVSDPDPWVEVFKDHLVVYEREDAQGRIRVYKLKDMSSYTIDFPERLYFAAPMRSPDLTTENLRIKYWSLVTPTTVYDFDLTTHTLDVKKRQHVPGYDASKYAAEMLFATAKDGTRVPITLVHKKSMKRDGQNPCLLYGYGAYGTFEWAKPEFDTTILSLLDRGFVYAYAHIRGGSEMTRKWHIEGRMEKKMNSFTDFIACAEHLVKEEYTSPKKLAIMGRSAGGLLIGGVTNLRPDLFKVVVAEVPYVDGVTTMLDPTIPLTIGEFEEWGNPAIREHYEFMLRYSPYDNVARKAYPNMLVTGGLNDSRVQYWEPLKWVAKLRVMKTDDNALLLRIGMIEGHAGASGRYDHLRYDAFKFAFMLDRLGIKE